MTQHPARPTVTGPRGSVSPTPTGPGSTRPTTTKRPPRPEQRGATVTRLAPLQHDADDPDAAVPMAEIQGTLALDLRGCTGMPTTPELRVVGEGETAVDELHAWSARFAQAVVEVLGGDRPLTQLLRWTTSRVYQDLGRRVRVLARTSAANQRLRTVRPQVRSVHVCRPAPHCAEVSVHVRHGRRSRAIAARLELVDGHWRCTALELG